MNLSICIPIYNYDVTRLVSSLCAQAEMESCNYEVILMDDCSQKCQKENALLDSLPRVSYIKLPQNIGRSAIRNQLAKRAQYEYILFMDCDTAVLDDQFIHRYISTTQNNTADVIIGGYHYNKEKPDRRHLLRWTYGIHREEKSANVRNLHPQRSFSTFNFLIKKSIFDTIQFNESILTYGHEDTIFGWEMKKMGFTFLHIQNPATHLVYEETNDFLQKTESSLQNLWKIYQNITEKEEFIHDIKILRYLENIQRNRLLTLTCFSLGLCRNMMHRNLFSSHPSLIVYDLYKLNILCHIAKQKNS